MRCHGCYCERAPSRCSVCKAVRYCSEICKQADEPIHKQECQAICSIQVKYYGSASAAKGQSTVIPSSTVRLAARLVWQRKLRGQEWWQAIESLLPCSRDLEYKKSAEASQLAHYLSFHSMPCEWNKQSIPSIERLEQLCGCVTRNSFIAYDGFVGKVGTCLNVVASMFNHSCDSNVSLVFPNGSGVLKCMHFVAAKDIKPGEELTVSYIDSSKPYHLRQAELQERYRFTCKCSLCTVAKAVTDGSSREIDLREALLCNRPKCSGLVALDWSKKAPVGLCTGCNRPSKLESREVAAALDQGMALLDGLAEYKLSKEIGLSFEMPSPIDDNLLQEARITLKALTAIQPPSSYPLVKLLFRAIPLIDRQWRYCAMVGYRQEASNFRREAYQAKVAGSTRNSSW